MGDYNTDGYLMSRVLTGSGLCASVNTARDASQGCSTVLRSPAPPWSPVRSLALPLINYATLVKLLNLPMP